MSEVALYSLRTNGDRVTNTPIPAAPYRGTSLIRNDYTPPIFVAPNRGTSLIRN